MCTSFFPSEIKSILLNEYGIRKFLVRFQFSEQIFTYGTEMVRPVFLDEENVLSSLNKFPNKSMQQRNNNFLLNLIWSYTEATELLYPWFFNMTCRKHLELENEKLRRQMEKVGVVIYIIIVFVNLQNL